MTLIASNLTCHSVLVDTDHVPQVFRIELARQGRRTDQIHEHHRELPSVWRRCWTCVLCRWSVDRGDACGWILPNRAFELASQSEGKTKVTQILFRQVGQNVERDIMGL